MEEVIGIHTYDVIAKTMEEVIDEYESKNKIIFTVTDSGSNFLKAF